MRSTKNWVKNILEIHNHRQPSPLVSQSLESIIYEIFSVKWKVEFKIKSETIIFISFSQTSEGRKSFAVVLTEF